MSILLEVSNWQLILVTKTYKYRTIVLRGNVDSSIYFSNPDGQIIVWSKFYTTSLHFNLVWVKWIKELRVVYRDAVRLPLDPWVEARQQWPWIYWSILLANVSTFVDNTTKTGKKPPKKTEKMNVQDGTSICFKVYGVMSLLFSSSFLTFLVK